MIRIPMGVLIGVLVGFLVGLLGSRVLVGQIRLGGRVLIRVLIGLLR
jgi:hypothetical protein